MYGQSLHISIMVNIDQATKENGARMCRFVSCVVSCRVVQ
jgi:hypothetical protein